MAEGGAARGAAATGEGHPPDTDLLHVSVLNLPTTNYQKEKKILTTTVVDSGQLVVRNKHWIVTRCRARGQDDGRHWSCRACLVSSCLLVRVRVGDHDESMMSAVERDQLF
jgi:hypothetical protein